MTALTSETLPPPRPESLFAILIMGTGLLWAGLMVGNIMSIVATLDRASARQAARVSAVARLVR